MYTFPIKPPITPEMAHFQKMWGALKYLVPVISIRCKNFKPLGQFEGKHNLRPRE